MNSICLNYAKTVIRSGCKDIWNAFMAEGASWGKYDIPFCPTTATSIPTDVITWDEAKAIHKKRCKDTNYKYNAFVCFYMDDYKFDSLNGIWNKPYAALEVLSHFEGIITPDYSTYQDFPISLQIYNTYRMRLFGFWLGKNGIQVINNVRGGISETFGFCFEGIPTNSIVAIGTVGGSPRKTADRERFENWISQMVDVLNPHTVIVYGSANYPCFVKLKEQGIAIRQYDSLTARSFKRRADNE